MFDYLLIVFVATSLSDPHKYTIRDVTYTISSEECMKEAEEYNEEEPIGSFTFATCVPLLDKSMSDTLDWCQTRLQYKFNVAPQQANGVDAGSNTTNYANQYTVWAMQVCP